MAHQMKGLKVGVLDVDLCGPSIPRMFGLQNSEVHQSEAGAFLKNISTLFYIIFHFIQGWCPVYTDQSQTIGVMSIGFLLNNQVSAASDWLKQKKTHL